MAGFVSKEGTLVGNTSQTFNFRTELGQPCKTLVYVNDDASATHRLVTNGQTVNVLAGEQAVLTGTDTYDTLVIGGDAGSTGAYRCRASTSDVPPLFYTQAGFPNGSVTTADLADGILSANAAGRAKMADDYFTNAEFVAGAGGKFAPGSLDTTALANVVADDAFTSTEVSTVGAGGKFAAGAITTAATAAGGLFAAGSLNTAGLANVIADDAFTSTEVSTVGAGGKFAAGAITTAATAAGGLFAAGALNTAGIANTVADDAFTSAEFAVGAGGKFAANCLASATEADNFIATGAIGEDRLSAAELTGRVMAVVASANVIGGIPVVHMVPIDAAAGNNEVTLTHKTRVFFVLAIKTVQAGLAGGTLTVQNGAAAITDAMVWDNTTADTTLQIPATIDDANWDIAAGGALRCVTNNAQSDGVVFVVGVRIA